MSQTNLPALIETNQDKFLAVMENPEKFNRLRSLFESAVNKNPKLASCSPASLMGSLKKLAQYDLDLTDENMAYLVPRKSECSLQVGFRGLQQIFYNKGGKKVFAQTVYSDDEFDIDLDKQVINKHKPGKERKEISGFYGVAVMQNGEQLVHYMTKSQMDEQRKKSMSDNYWENGFIGMSEKTVIRKVLNKVPQAKMTYLDAPETEIGKREFGLMNRAEVLEAESADIFGGDEDA